MLADGYSDLEVLSIAANGKEISFSSDTGMAECLVVARKRATIADTRVTRFTSLRRRPQGFAEASAIAQPIAAGATIRNIADGPYGGTILAAGREIAGEMLSTAGPDNGDSWGSVRVADYSLAQTAHALTQSQLWLPGQSVAHELATVKLGDVGELGLVDRDITGPRPRGPFDKAPPSATATYPALWSHDAKKESWMVCCPDSQLRVRGGLEDKAATVWTTASRTHVSRGFRFNSQPLAIAFTRQRTIGGRGWPNVVFNDQRFDYACTVWGNSTLGMFLYWWHANVQVAGRGDMTIRAAEGYPILDFRNLTDEQLAAAQAIFDEFGELDLMPAYLADADPNRALLDRRVVCDLLGFDEDIYRGVRQLAEKWCAEPSVHGGKARPRGSKLAT